MLIAVKNENERKENSQAIRDRIVKDYINVNGSEFALSDKRKL